VAGDPGGDIPLTRRRVRWFGVGTGSYEEVSTVYRLMTPALVSETSYLALVDSPPEFPPGETGTVRFLREFGSGEISLLEDEIVLVSEAGMFVDVDPAEPVANGGTEDVENPAPGVTGVLDPAFATNAPVAYFTFEPIPKGNDVNLILQWDLTFLP